MDSLLAKDFLTRVFELGWARRIDGSRIVSFNATGETEFMLMLAV